MSPDGLHRLRLAMRRQRACELAFSFGRLGGWAGKREEQLRFLSLFSLWRETHDISDRFFTANIPYHEAGCCLWPDSRN